MSAEYIMAEGNENVILCERGIRTFETFTRNTLDISAIPAIRQMSHLPIVVDPSHAAGMYWMVEPPGPGRHRHRLRWPHHRGPQRPAPTPNATDSSPLTPAKFDALMRKVTSLRQWLTQQG